MLDFVVKFKFCETCRYWEHSVHGSEKFQNWKKEHEGQCKSNFEGIASSMEPCGALKFFLGLWTTKYDTQS